MKYPPLVPDLMCKTPCRVVIFSEEISEDGAPVVVADFAAGCNWQAKAKTVLTKEQKQVTITGTAYFNGDIAPDTAVISGGKLTVHGVQRDILQGTKAYNPDGTVNYTLLEVF